jgi:hypothetical protein
VSAEPYYLLGTGALRHYVLRLNIAKAAIGWARAASDLPPAPGGSGSRRRVVGPAGLPVTFQGEGSWWLDCFVPAGSSSSVAPSRRPGSSASPVAATR